MKKFKLPKKLWVKGKSKFLELRPELHNPISFKISDDDKKQQEKEVMANKMRRLTKYGRA